jgi:ribose 5-phosphate isomerase
VETLGTTWKQGIPLEVIDIAYRPIQLQIVELLGGSAQLRMGKSKMVNLNLYLKIFLFSSRIIR